MFGAEADLYLIEKQLIKKWRGNQKKGKKMEKAAKEVRRMKRWWEDEETHEKKEDISAVKIAR